MFVRRVETRVLNIKEKSESQRMQSEKTNARFLPFAELLRLFFFAFVVY